jgi:hypothetical protein
MDLRAAMTLARTKEDAMTPTAKPKQQARAIDSAQRRKETGLRIARPVMIVCS